MRLRSTLSLTPWLFAFVLFAACDGQSEGQVCSLENGNADCADNLVCTTVSGLNSDRCCPSNPSQSTTAVCGVHQSGLDADTATPALEDGPDGDGGDSADAPPDATLDEPPDDAPDGDASETEAVVVESDSAPE